MGSFTNKYIANKVRIKYKTSIYKNGPNQYYAVSFLNPKQKKAFLYQEAKIYNWKDCYDSEKKY
jgi:hypothetical protein